MNWYESEWNWNIDWTDVPMVGNQRVLMQYRGAAAAAKEWRDGRYEEISKAWSNPLSLSFSLPQRANVTDKKIKGDISQRSPRLRRGRNTLTRWEIRDWFRLNCVFRLNPLALTERFSPLRGSITRAHRYLAGEGEPLRNKCWPDLRQPPLQNFFLLFTINTRLESCDDFKF